MKIRYSLLFFLMTIAGCRKKEFKEEIKNLKGKSLEHEQVLAQHTEIPDTHIGFEIDSIIQNPLDSQTLEIVYKPIKKMNITIKQVQESYIADMEMLGWECIGSFEGPSIQLIFQKAGKKLLSTLEIESNLRIKMVVYTKK